MKTRNMPAKIETPASKKELRVFEIVTSVLFALFALVIIMSSIK